MAATPSNMLALGTSAPDFNLLDTVSAKIVSLNDLKSDKATVIMFICNHCPFVKHINQGIAEFANDYIPQGVSVIAISSNDVDNYPADSPEKMTENAKEQGFNFPYLYDETQDVAKAYQAACTPDFYVFDSELKLAYRGQFDSSRPNNMEAVTGKDVREAVGSLLNGNRPNEEQIPSIGCNIKWKM